MMLLINQASTLRPLWPDPTPLVPLNTLNPKPYSTLRPKLKPETLRRWGDGGAP